MTGPTPVPDPTRLHPSSRPELTNVVLLRAQVTSELIEVGEFTYHDDEGSGVPFESGNVHYLYGPQRLIIGRFTAIGPGVEILMPGGNHPMVGPSTYPFTMFGGQWTERTMDTFRSIEPLPDTRIGNDVWLGRKATVLPGVRIGDGAVVGARGGHQGRRALRRGRRQPGPTRPHPVLSRRRHHLAAGALVGLAGLGDHGPRGHDHGWQRRRDQPPRRAARRVVRTRGAGTTAGGSMAA